MYEPRVKAVRPDRIGTYEIALGGDKLVRVAAPAEREVDLRPRSVSPQTKAASLGDVRSRVDLSPYIAISLLALLVAELGLRIWARRTSTPVSGAGQDLVETRQRL